MVTAFAFAQVKSTVMRSAVTFKIKNFGITNDGVIGGLKAEVNFNPADLAKSSMEASADVNTINTDNSMRDDHLKSDKFFDVAHYPRITIKSVSFKHDSGRNYTGQFSVTIKDKTRVLAIPFRYNETGNAATLAGSFKLKRSDFGIGGSGLTLGDEVTVAIDVTVSK
jgi:polyisoprenoid-binding protein YceI